MTYHDRRDRANVGNTEPPPLWPLMAGRHQSACRAYAAALRLGVAPAWDEASRIFLARLTPAEAGCGAVAHFLAMEAADQASFIAHFDCGRGGIGDVTELTPAFREWRARR